MGDFHHVAVTQPFPAVGDVVSGEIAGHGLVDLLDGKYAGALVDDRISDEGTVKAKVVSIDHDAGLVMVSEREYQADAQWQKVPSTMEVLFISQNKGGFIGRWEALDVFMPASQAIEAAPGELVTVDLIEANRERGNIVVSEKRHVRRLKREEKALKKERLAKSIAAVQQGTDYKGVVTNVDERFGVFIDLQGEDVEGVTGLLHNRRVLSPLHKGQEVLVRVTAVKDGKIDLAQIEEEWKTLKKGEIVKGWVIAFTDHGALVKVANGIIGLIKRRDLTDDIKAHSTQYVRIQRIDQERNRVALTPHKPAIDIEGAGR